MKILEMKNDSFIPILMNLYLTIEVPRRSSPRKEDFELIPSATALSEIGSSRERAARREKKQRNLSLSLGIKQQDLDRGRSHSVDCRRVADRRLTAPRVWMTRNIQDSPSTLTKYSKIVKRIVLENIPREFKRKIDLLDERQYREKRTMLTGRQISCQILSFFDIHKIQGRAMSVADMLNIEL